MADLLSGDGPSASVKFVPLDDALERMGKHYAVLATAFIVTCGETIPENPLPKREHGPTPFEVFLYYHVLIAAKIYRAISSAHTASRTGSAQARWDADVSRASPPRARSCGRGWTMCRMSAWLRARPTRKSTHRRALRNCPTAS